MYSLESLDAYYHLNKLTIKSNFIRQMSSLHGQMVYLCAPEVIVLDKDMYELFVDADCPVVIVTAS